MKRIFPRTAQPTIPKNITTLYLLGDDNASKQLFYEQLSIDKPEEGQQISIIIKQIGQNEYLEIYDFPTDKMLRNALQLYFNILTAPTLILYFLHRDATQKDMHQWIRLLKQTHAYYKLVFVSDVRSYLEREKIIVRIGNQFECSVIEHICFSGLDQAAFDKMFGNIKSIGLVIATAVCLRPTWRERIGQSWGNISNKIRRITRGLKNKTDEKSVI